MGAIVGIYTMDIISPNMPLFSLLKSQFHKIDYATFTSNNLIFHDFSRYLSAY